MKTKDRRTFFRQPGFVLPSLFFLLVFLCSSAIELAHWCDDLEGHARDFASNPSTVCLHTAASAPSKLTETTDHSPFPHACHPCLISQGNLSKMFLGRAMSLQAPVTCRLRFGCRTFVRLVCYHNFSPERAPPAV